MLDGGICRPLQAVEEVVAALPVLIIHSTHADSGGRVMRGGDERSGDRFSYVDLEARARSEFAAGDPGDSERGAGGSGA